MTTLERSIIIKATREKIDAIALDGNRLPEWYAGIHEAKPDDAYPEIGGIVDAVYKTAGVSFNITITSTELVRGEKITMELDGMITGENRWQYTDEEDGVRVTCTMAYELPAGRLGKAANKLLVEKMNSGNLEKSLLALKTLVEAA